MRNTGDAVEVAEGGSEALALLAERSYDLILLNFRMKGMTGEQVYEMIASRFIRLTGRPVLAKPFTLGKPEMRVAQLIRESR